MESPFPSLQLYADELVESAGAVVFNIQSQHICILHHRTKNEYLLPKGRRNTGESRLQAAIREILEETGWHSLPLPVIMSTRAPPSQELGYTPDVAEVRETMGDPFALTVREEIGRRRKFIWWYIAKVDDSMEQRERSEIDLDLQPVFVSYERAAKMLSYKGDRELVERAIELVRNSLPSQDKE